MTHPFQFAGGIVIVGIVLLDVFGTIVVPRAARQRLRIAPLIVASLAPVWRRAAALPASPRLRQSVRGAMGPAILVLLMTAWMALLTLGFALIFHAEPNNVRADDFGFGQSLFQSAMALSTLGTIDAKIEGWGRAVVAIAGIAGFATLSLTVAFVIAIQGALHRREGLVLTMAARTGRPPTAFALLADYRGTGDGELAALFERWETWAADLTQSHLSYPVLMFFHSLDEDVEWLCCLAAVADAGALIAAAAPADYPRASAAGRRLAYTADRTVQELGKIHRIAPALPSPGDAGALPAALAAVGIRLGPAGGFEQRWEAARPHARLRPLIAERVDIVWTDPLGAEL